MDYFSRLLGRPIVRLDDAGQDCVGGRVVPEVGGSTRCTGRPILQVFHEEGHGHHQGRRFPHASVGRQAIEQARMDVPVDLGKKGRYES